MILPFGLAVSEPVRVTDEAGTALAETGFFTCIPAGCIVNVELTGEIEETLSSGGLVRFETAEAGNGETVRMSLNPSGFAEGLARLRG